MYSQSEEAGLLEKT
uniref:Uncharacterized protein n=1 Tax=Moniliophthora roreri TaxID=221103 RepID=A0A0W0FAX5_MONRR